MPASAARAPDVPKLKLKVPYLVWRDGRPRWVPGPALRAKGAKGADLKSAEGAWLGLEAAIEAARKLNAEMADARPLTPKPAARGASVVDLVEDYMRSDDFSRLAATTQDTARSKLRAIKFRPARHGEPETRELFGLSPARAIGKPEAKAFFEHCRKTRGLVSARHIIMLVSAAWKWGSTSTTWRLTGENPCHKLNLPTADARIRVAIEAEIRALDGAAEALGLWSVVDAVYLALFSGQRQTDVLLLADPFGSNRSAADRAAAGEPIRLRQKKTGAVVAVFCAPPLVARLAQMEERRRARAVVRDELLVDERSGAPFVSRSQFDKRWREVRDLAIAGDAARGLEPCPSLNTLTFRDLRDTAVTWLFRAGANYPEIGSITGHSPATIITILKHYLLIDETDARRANDKLTAWLAAQGMRL